MLRIIAEPDADNNAKPLPSRESGADKTYRLSFIKRPDNEYCLSRKLKILHSVCIVIEIPARF